MSFAVQHTRALASVRRKGVALGISRTDQGTEQPDGTYPDAVTTSIPVVAIDSGGDVARYAALGLVYADAVTLFCVPLTYSLKAHTPEFALPGDALPWNGETFTVRDVGPVVAPDGIIIASTIVATV